MNRKQLTSVMIFLIAFLTIAAAAYAPHNARWQKVAQDNTVYAPCRNTMEFSANAPQQVVRCST